MTQILQYPQLQLLAVGNASSDRFSGLSDRIASVSAYENEVVDVDAETAFRTLVDEWRRETGMLSSLPKKIQHPAYRTIIAMGGKAIPLILAELRDRPSHWFEALRAITKQTPVPAQDRADPRKVREAWLKWGRAQGYLN